MPLLEEAPPMVGPAGSKLSCAKETPRRAAARGGVGVRSCDCIKVGNINPNCVVAHLCPARGIRALKVCVSKKGFSSEILHGPTKHDRRNA